MNRITQIFARSSDVSGGTLMPFITAGHPDLATTAELLPALQRAGAGICEIGFPFSDPIADGPVIQASMTRALAGGVHPAQIFEMVQRLRDQLEMGLLAMVSYSIVFRLGPETFVQQAAEAGFDGFIFPDLPLEEAGRMGRLVKDAGLISSLLIAPTTPPDRAEAIARASSGFIYLVARTGITGAREDIPRDLADRIGRLRKVTDLPIAVGFGIARRDQVQAVTSVADAAIVGSALVGRIDELAAEGKDAAGIAAEAEKFVADLAGGLRHPTN